MGGCKMNSLGSFLLSHNTSSGQYYISFKGEKNKYNYQYGKEYVLYSDSLGYFFRKGKTSVYLTSEQVEALNSFRKSNIA
jgi:hypothetical protein